MSRRRVTRFSNGLWFWLAHVTYPKWLYDGPYWWRCVNAWWLPYWGSLFFHTRPWHPGRHQN